MSSYFSYCAVVPPPRSFFSLNKFWLTYPFKCILNSALYNSKGKIPSKERFICLPFLICAAVLGPQILAPTKLWSNLSMILPKSFQYSKRHMQYTVNATCKRHMQYSHVKDKLFNDLKICLELNTLRLKLWIYNCFFYWWNSSSTVWADIYQHGHFIELLVAVVCRSCRASCNDFVGTVFIKYQAKLLFIFPNFF